MMKAHYSFADIIAAYKNAGIKKGDLVFIESDMASLGVFTSHNAENIAKAHCQAIREIIGNDGTIVVPTFSIHILREDKKYNPQLTRSEMGFFSEYLRNIPGAIRSKHALTSYAALGPDAEKICLNTSHLAYGPHSPMDRMIKSNAVFLSIGLKPYDTCSTVHQTEVVMGAPYRFIKEFNVIVEDSGMTEPQKAYMHVQYLDSNIKKDKRSLFSYFESRCTVLKVKLGRGFVYKYSMSDFYKCSCEYFINNPYAILAEVPERKPYSDAGGL